MNTVRPRKWLIAALILLVGGIARLPLEHAFSKELQTHRLAEEKINLSLRDELGQSFFIAVIGGFRSLVASIVEVENLDSWQEQNWAKVDAAYSLCTRLQPREYHYWDFRAWMSSHNAFDYYLYEDMTRPGLQPWIRQNLVEHAIKVLKEGMEHLPNDYRLPRSLAMLMADFDKNRDANHFEASQWYYKAWELRPSLRFLRRNYIYNLARSPGHEIEAWPLLMEMYNSGPDPASDRTATGMTLLVQLYPKVKAALPETTLPPELAAKAPQILARENARLDREVQQRQRQADQLKELEATILENRQGSPPADSATQSRIKR